MREKLYHFIGIGGIGMSALARILLGEKVTVTGSDLSSNGITESLTDEGAKIFKGHCGTNVAPGATVVYSTAVNDANPEVVAAHSLGSSLIHRSDLLRELMRGYKTLSVAGSHGKTTTSSLLASLLKEAGKEPSFAVGGVITGLKTNGERGKGNYFVAEADESDGTFIKYPSYGAIVTNLEEEHLDHYGDKKSLIAAFRQFIDQVEEEELLFCCGDDQEITSLAQGRGETYGFNEGNSFQISHRRQDGWSSFFHLTYKGKVFTDVELNLLGKHNVLNGAAVFALAWKLGIKEEVIRKVFKEFKGISRRCEKVGEGAVTIIDDYAHHPSEVSTTLEGIRSAVGERRIIVAFQPHRYSRTKDCLEKFGTVFDRADRLFLTEIAAAGEKVIPGVSHEKIIEKIEASSTLPVEAVSREELLEKLVEVVHPHDVVVTMGAGDITKVGRGLAEELKKKSLQKYRVAIVRGGRSSEHAISLTSGEFFLSHISKEFYDVEEIIVSRKGQWGTSKAELDGELLEKILRCDLFIPVLHGPYGEDGMIQGFFDILNRPYVGSDHRSCALCMDKALTKKIVTSAGIATAPFVDFSVSMWERDKPSLLKGVEEKLSFPLFVKPSHQGSSIGVKRVVTSEELVDAVDAAFKVDTHLVIEKEIIGRELEFALLGNESIRVAGPGEICSEGVVYSYEKKYGENAAKTDISPDLPIEVIQEGQTLASKVYDLLQCSGLTRVDFFLDQHGKYWLNECNPFPGFTSISLYPKLWEKEGLSFSKLIDELIVLALHKHRRQERHFG